MCNPSTRSYWVMDKLGHPAPRNKTVFLPITDQIDLGVGLVYVAYT